MKKIAGPFYLVLIASVVVTFGAYAADAQAARKPSDEALKARVQAALLSASDVPGREIAVEASGGVVTLTGRLSSDVMRGVAYPGAILQQSVGAIVRAVPGVKDVRFSVQIEPAQPATITGTNGASPDRDSSAFFNRKGVVQNNLWQHPGCIRIQPGGC